MANGSLPVNGAREARRYWLTRIRAREDVFRYLDELLEKKEEKKPRKRIGFKSDDL
jgi:hypothetical protein